MLGPASALKISEGATHEQLQGRWRFLTFFCFFVISISCSPVSCNCGKCTIPQKRKESWLKLSIDDETWHDERFLHLTCILRILMLLPHITEQCCLDCWEQQANVQLAKTIMTHSRIINKFMIKIGGLFEPTDNCNKTSNVITFYIMNVIRKKLFLSALRKWTRDAQYPNDNNLLFRMHPNNTRWHFWMNPNNYVWHILDCHLVVSFSFQVDFWVKWSTAV